MNRFNMRFSAAQFLLTALYIIITAVMVLYAVHYHPMFENRSKSLIPGLFFLSGIYASLIIRTEPEYGNTTSQTVQ